MAALHLAPPELASEVGAYYYAAVAAYFVSYYTARNKTVRIVLRVAEIFCRSVVTNRSTIFTGVLVLAPAEAGLTLPALVLLSACCRLVADRRIRTVMLTCLVWCGTSVYRVTSLVARAMFSVARALVKLVGSVMPYVGQLSFVVLCLLGVVIISIILSLPSLLALPFVQQRATTFINAMQAKAVYTEAAQGNMWPAASQLIGWAISGAPTALFAAAQIFGPVWLKAPIALVAGQPILHVTRSSSFPIVTEMP